MEQTVLKELHDAKLKAVDCINKGDMELAEKYQEVIRELERTLKLLEK